MLCFEWKVDTVSVSLCLFIGWKRTVDKKIICTSKLQKDLRMFKLAVYFNLFKGLCFLVGPFCMSSHNALVTPSHLFRLRFAVQTFCFSSPTFWILSSPWSMTWGNVLTRQTAAPHSALFELSFTASFRQCAPCLAQTPASNTSRKSWFRSPWPTFYRQKPASSLLPHPRPTRSRRTELVLARTKPSNKNRWKKTPQNWPCHPWPVWREFSNVAVRFFERAFTRMFSAF